MPFSSDSGKAQIDFWLKKYHQHAPISSILDIGAGSGTYSKRYRQKYGLRWHAVEVWEPYIEKYDLKSHYDKIVNVDVTSPEFETFLESFEYDSYDVIFAGDVLEHVHPDKLPSLINLLLDHTKLLFISIPIGHYPQDEYDGNPHEAHLKDDWTHDEVMNVINPQWVKRFTIDNEIGVYACSKVLTDNPEDRNPYLDPSVAVYAICKNEKHFVERFIHSLYRQGIEQVVVCDTGSTDGTYEKFLAEFNKDAILFNFPRFMVKQISVKPWRFDDARNTALSFVDPDIDLCISLDLDEILDEGFVDQIVKHFSAKVTRYNHRFKTYWDWISFSYMESVSPVNDYCQSISSHWHERIHTREGYRWILPVHEKLIYQGQEVLGWLHDATMIQYPDTTKSRSSYLPLLIESVQEQQDVWRSWFFLGQEQAGNGDFTGAIQSFEKALALPDVDAGFMKRQLAFLHERAGDLNLAERLLIEAAAASVNSREAWVEVARFYDRQQRYKDAAIFITRAKTLTHQSLGYDYDPSCWGEKFDEYVKFIEMMGA